jgi:hypothetical protein
MIKDQVKMGNFEYGKDLDVTKCINGIRHTINPSVGTVSSDLLFDFFDVQKCSIRLLRPHEFSPSLARTITAFEELF